MPCRSVSTWRLVWLVEAPSPPCRIYARRFIKVLFLLNGTILKFLHFTVKACLVSAEEVTRWENVKLITAISIVVRSNGLEILPESGICALIRWKIVNNSLHFVLYYVFHRLYRASLKFLCMPIMLVLSWNSLKSSRGK